MSDRYYGCMTPDDPCADPNSCDSLACARDRLHLTLRDEADQREGHLPECRVRTYTTDDGMVYEVAGDLCICPALRACEQRVLAKRYVDSCPACWAGAHDACYSSEKCGCRTCEYDRGRAAGLDAARDAVAAAQADAGDINFCKDCADWSVAAIDALKGEQA